MLHSSKFTEPNPWNLWCYFIWREKKKDFGDVCRYFKDLEMGKLVWILSGWAQNAITNIIVRRKQRKIWHTEEENSIWQQKQRMEWFHQKPSSPVAGKPNDCWSIWKEHSSAHTLILAQWYWSDFRPRELWVNKSLPF